MTSPRDMTIENIYQLGGAWPQESMHQEAGHLKHQLDALEITNPIGTKNK